MVKWLIVAKLVFLHETRLVLTPESVSCLSKCNNLLQKEGIIKKSIKNIILTGYYKNLQL